jgi:hypothetical protein
MTATLRVSWCAHPLLSEKPTRRFGCWDFWAMRRPRSTRRGGCCFYYLVLPPLGPSARLRVGTPSGVYRAMYCGLSCALARWSTALDFPLTRNDKAASTNIDAAAPPPRRGCRRRGGGRTAAMGHDDLRDGSGPETWLTRPFLRIEILRPVACRYHFPASPGRGHIYRRASWWHPSHRSIAGGGPDVFGAPRRSASCSGDIAVAYCRLRV